MRLVKEESELFAQERADYSNMMHRLATQKRVATSPGVELVCVGNSGGADNIVHARATGGFLLRYANRNIIVDPGDNSLSCLLDTGFNPYELTDVLASHAHDDHVGDLSSAVMAALNLSNGSVAQRNIVICPALVDYTSVDATKHGFTLPEFAWKGNVVPLHWQVGEITSFDGRRIAVKDRVTLADGIEVKAVEAHHGTIPITGFVIDTPIGRLGYSADSEYFEGMGEQFLGCDLLWLNLNTLGLSAVNDTDPDMNALDEGFVSNHLGYRGACELIDAVQPTTAIVSHLGTQLLPYRSEIESLFRARFGSLGIKIHVPENGDSYYFKTTLKNVPLRRRRQQ